MKKRHILALILGGGFLYGLYSCESPNDRDAREAAEELVWQKDIADAKAELVARMDANPGTYNKTMDCAARRISSAAVQTHYQAYLIHRADLPTPAERDHMIDQWLDAIPACGGSLSLLTQQMEQDADNVVMQGLTVALVRQGR